MSEALDRVSIILVKPLQAGNVGAAARAMKNMGLRRMKLVKPPDLRESEWRKMAVGAVELVEDAAVFASLEEALADEHVVIGTTSCRGRRRRTRLYTPREISPLIWGYAASQRVGIVFGPERRGLSEAHLALCQYLVTIPTSSAHPTLNLAQAVLVLAYELFSFQPVALNLRRRLASEAERGQMLEHMQQVLIHIGYLSQSNPHHIMRSIRRLLGQAELTKRDVQILRGIMSQMEWYVRQGRNLSPEEVRKP